MANKGNVTKFPITWDERWRNRHPFGVHCLISDRWLQFPESYSDGPHGKKYIWLDVMTRPNEKERRLATLCLSKDELLAILEKME